MSDAVSMLSDVHTLFRIKQSCFQVCGEEEFLAGDTPLLDFAVIRRYSVHTHTQTDRHTHTYMRVMKCPVK